MQEGNGSIAAPILFETGKKEQQSGDSVLRILADWRFKHIGSFFRICALKKTKLKKDYLFSTARPSNLCYSVAYRWFREIQEQTVVVREIVTITFRALHVARFPAAHQWRREIEQRTVFVCEIDKIALQNNVTTRISRQPSIPEKKRDFSTLKCLLKGCIFYVRVVRYARLQMMKLYWGTQKTIPIGVRQRQVNRGFYPMSGSSFGSKEMQFREL